MPTYTGTTADDVRDYQSETSSVTFSAGAGNDSVIGSDHNDTLLGQDGDDTLDGAAGADALTGGAGNDTYLVADAGDAVTEVAGGGTADMVRTTRTAYTLGAEVEHLVYAGAAAFTGTGNALANAITGGADADTLNGGAGDDALDGGAGADSLVGGAGNDTYVVDNVGDTVTEVAGEGTDTVRTTLASLTLAANVENLVYTGAAAFAGTGNALANAITGGFSSDVLNGGAGADTLTGSFGNDTYVVDNAGDVVTEAAGEGTDTVRTALASLTLAANVENLVYTGVAAFTGTGNALANRLTGGAGNDTLNGGAGADILTGGAGDDTYVVSDALDLVIEAAGAGTDTVQTSLAAYSLAARANVENLVHTGSAAFIGTGNALANRLTGGAGNDVLNGGTGADTLEGGAGDDTYVLDNAGDAVIELAGGGTADVVRTTLAAHTLAANVENLVYTGAVAFRGTGNALANRLTGGAGKDTLDGGAGADSLTGGKGDDTYVVDDAGDAVAEAAAEGTDTVRTALASLTLAAGVENLEYTGGAAAFAGTGNLLANAIKGGSGADTLSGLAGADTLDGGAGADSLTGGLDNDTYVVDDALDVVTETASGGTADTVRTTLASLTLAANVENLEYTGAAAFAGTGNVLANRLTGGSGNDVLNGGAGIDTLVGGLGNDTYVLDDAGDVVTETASGGAADTVSTTLASFSLAAYAYVENLVHTGGGAFAGTGNALANRLTGGAGNDVLDGGAGADILAGLQGDDAYVVSDALDLVVEAAGAGTDTVRTTLASHTLAANVENLEYTGAAAFRGTGNTLANAITGGSGSDTLDGGAGADILTGGAGDDTYLVDNAGDVVTEVDGEGAADTVRTTLATHTLAANVENLEYTGLVTFSGRGNALANAITGGAGKDTLDGGAGADTLTGGKGDDTYVANDVGDVVTEASGAGTDTVRTSLASLTLAANVENLEYTGAEAIAGTGNDLANAIKGGSGTDTLAGLAGDDTLDGGAGADSLAGGADNDTYVVDDAGDVVTETGSGGTADTVRTTLASYDLGANVENLEYTGVAAFAGTGNALANRLTGGVGADTLDGGAGADSLAGGLGNDTYLVDDAGDVVTEALGAGTDTVRTTLASFTLSAHANVENLVYAGSATFAGIGTSQSNGITGGAKDDTLAGGSGNDTLTGLAGDDSLDGGAGADRLVGGTGDDTYLVDNAGDAVTEVDGEGTDKVHTTLASHTLAANVENLVYTGAAAFRGTGNALANAITGGSGNDTLDGGAGGDALTAGLGNDTYVVDDAGDAVTEAAAEGTDTVRTTLASHTLAANVENLVYTGGGAFAGTGNALANAVTGAFGKDTLDGGAGADTLTGGFSNDTFRFSMGEANGDTVADFNGVGPQAGDVLVFVGYGTGATFTMVSATEWKVVSGDGLVTETITFANSATIHSSDYIFE